MNNREFVKKITNSAARFPKLTFTQRPSVNTCVNPYSYHIVRKNQELYGNMDGLYVDGMLMCKLINLLWGTSIPRLSFDMSGMAVDLFKRLNSSQESVYFVGAKQEALEQSVAIIKQSYPQIQVAGYRNGYFLLPEHRTQEINKIVSENPDFVIVGMGSPLQEQFALDLKNAGFQGIVFTCGGFLHQTANGIKYYPDWINRYNLRAFYRLYKEKGLFKRLYNVLIEFPILFIYDTIKTKFDSANK